jgi:hypothetical protein
MILMADIAINDNGSRDRDSSGSRGSSGGNNCKGNLTDLRRILHLSLAKGNPK